MKNTKTQGARVSFVIAAAAVWLASAPARAQELSGDSLIEALQDGGYVLVMRHASSSREPPGRRETAPANVDGERQLDDRGRATVTAMGYAFRELDLPVGDVLSSPAYRAVETAEYFGFGDLQTAAELGSEANDSEWLRMKVAEPPREGENRVIITHARNITEAFGDDASEVQAGEALIFRPDGENAALVARMPIEEWASLAVR